MNREIKPKTKKSSSKPAELPANKPVGRFRQVIEVTSKNLRDPRFDNLSGKFNEDLFKKSYSFVNEIKANEMQELKTKVSKTKDPLLKEKFSKQLNAELSKLAAEKQKEDRTILKRKIRSEEKDMVKQGKTPFYLKKSAIRQLELTQKFNQMKDKKNFDKVIEKKRKRNATKDHKKLPFKRRQEE
ncbi:ribosomal RNA processing protein 36 [Neoconidiobolus thromboides FSU 785]|nr:ribosomal RNA processing protein 36 [Neoconidiobolus thromboides FSU 785]